MATPLVGLAEESYHGGSIVMTSNKRPALSIWDLPSFSKSKVVTLTERGIHQNCFKCECYLKAARASSCLATLLIYLSSSSFSESSSSKNCFSNALMCFFTSLSMDRISYSSFGKLSMKTVSLPSARVIFLEGEPSSSSQDSSSA